jgi:hypothetical protein
MNEPCLKCGEYHNRCFELKELTDEEILKVSANKFLMSEHRLVLLFARELLRKAQEK